MDLDSAADELYGLAPDEFVPRRTALEKQARSEGDRALAGELHRLGKPTRSAWLVNLLSRDRPETVEQLLDLADLLAEGMRALSAPELQQLTRQRTKLVDSITRTAVAIGRDHGHRASDGTRAEVAGTLTAALADPEVAEEVRAGRLSRAVTWSGLGLPGASDAPATRPGGRGSRVGDRGKRQPGTRTGDGVAPVVELAPHRREAERARARKHSAQAAEEHRRAAAAVERSAARVAEAEERAASARGDADPAREEWQRAEASVAEAERALQRARRERDRVAGIADRAAQVLATAEERLRHQRDEDSRARTRLTEAELELRSAEEELAGLGDEEV